MHVIVRILMLLLPSYAFKKYLKLIPNGNKLPNGQAIGHASATDVALNLFGKVFMENGNKWSKELCNADADSDGISNGAELGDRCCQWTEGDTITQLVMKGLGNPGDASKLPTNTELKGGCVKNATDYKQKETSEGSNESSEPVMLHDDQDDEDESAEVESSHAVRARAFFNWLLYSVLLMAYL